MRKIQISNSPEELNSRAAELFTDIASDSIRSRGSFLVALSGGRTPRAVFELLATDEYRSNIDWSGVQFYFGDERNVPIDSQESNFRMANETLFTPLEIRPENIHRWLTELGPDAAAEDYRSKLSAIERFDLILLGLGDDGHTASLFPASSALLETEQRAVANWVEKLDGYRLTITFPVINDARNVIFLVSGSEKAGVVANVLEGDLQPDVLPAQEVRPVSGNLYWLLDAQAAYRLENK